jgi:hypothetical protein
VNGRVCASRRQSEVAAALVELTGPLSVNWDIRSMDRFLIPPAARFLMTRSRSEESSRGPRLGQRFGEHFCPTKSGGLWRRSGASIVRRNLSAGEGSFADQRIRQSNLLAAIRATPECVIEAGCEISVSVPPKRSCGSRAARQGLSQAFGSRAPLRAGRRRDRGF